MAAVATTRVICGLLRDWAAIFCGTTPASTSQQLTALYGSQLRTRPKAALSRLLDSLYSYSAPLPLSAVGTSLRIARSHPRIRRHS